MFELIQTFKKNGDFQITPILMEGEPIFLPQELESQLGYSDLSDSIRKNDGLLENIDFHTIKGDNLNKLKEILKRSNTPLQINPMAHRLTVLTESGFYAMAFRSNKPECVNFRIWVTSEVLPAIRRTGGYQASGVKLLPTDVAEQYRKAKEMAKASGLQGRHATLAADKMVESLLGVSPLKLLGEPQAYYRKPMPPRESRAKWDDETREKFIQIALKKGMRALPNKRRDWIKDEVKKRKKENKLKKLIERAKYLKSEGFKKRDICRKMNLHKHSKEIRELIYKELYQ